MFANRFLIAFAVTLAIIFIVPFVIYAGFSARGEVVVPEGAPVAFLLGVLVSKAGTALAFVGLFAAARGAFAGRWLLYAGLWWVMFVIGEAGQAIGPGYSWVEALAGVLSETIYFPAAAWVVDRLARR